MDQTAAALLPVLDEPAWPDETGPYLFVAEVSGPLERRLLDAWIERNRPDDVDRRQVQQARLPATRRRARLPADPALAAFIAADADALVVPLRVVWLAPQREGRRSVKVSDLLRLGDPRDPGPIRQYLMYRRFPDRVRIIKGATGRLPELRRSWSESSAIDDGRSLVDEVARKAWLTLERAERTLRGSRYKVPKFPRETLLDDRQFQVGVAKLARDSGVSYQRMAARTSRYVREIAATHSPWMIDVVTGGFRRLITKAYVELDYDHEELEALYRMGQRYPLVFLPTHKSHFDHQSLQFALYENGLPPNHTAGGINMNFFPVGPLIRRSGVFFIRREFRDNEPYKFVLRRYIDYLLQRRFPLEWYIEGARSRTGKLLPPKLGMLAYVVEGFQRGSADDVIFIPVAIAYDQIQDVQSYAAEQSGAPKRPETFAWMVRVIRGLQRRYGSIHLRLGRPISLRSFLADLGAEPADADDTRSPAVPKLAFEIANRINEVMPITPISLVTLVMLGDDRPSLDFGEIHDLVDPYATEAADRGLPSTTTEPLDDRAVVGSAIDQLVVHGIVNRQVDGEVIRYGIAPESQLAAAYYRNMVIHFFVDGAVAELALAGIDGAEGEPVDAVFAEARRIRRVLLFEFFFAGRDEYDAVIAGEIDRRCPDWRDLVAAGEVASVLDGFRPFRSPAILRPFLEAYRVVAGLIEDDAYMGTIDESTLVNRALKAGRDQLAAGTITSGQSVSKILFEAAVTLARHRGMFEPGPDVVERRKAFAAEIDELAERAGKLSITAPPSSPSPEG